MLLDVHKEEGRLILDSYIEKCENNYSKDNQAAVCGIVDKGKRAAGVAMNYIDIDTAVRKVKEEIAKVEKIFTDVFKNQSGS